MRHVVAACVAVRDDVTDLYEKTNVDDDFTRHFDQFVDIRLAVVDVSL